MKLKIRKIRVIFRFVFTPFSRKSHVKKGALFSGLFHSFQMVLYNFRYEQPSSWPLYIYLFTDMVERGGGVVECLGHQPNTILTLVRHPQKRPKCRSSRLFPGRLTRVDSKVVPFIFQITLRENILCPNLQGVCNLLVGRYIYQIHRKTNQRNKSFSELDHTISVASYYLLVQRIRN